jgi:hypothetical protein
MRVSRSSTFLFAGTSTGSLRVYNWPPSEEDGEKYIEYYLHSSAIVSVLESMDSKQLTTLGADGSMFVFKIAPKVQSIAHRSHVTSCTPRERKALTLSHSYTIITSGRRTLFRATPFPVLTQDVTVPADKDVSGGVAQTASADPDSDEPLRKIVPREVAGQTITGYGNDMLPWEYNHDVVCMSISDMEDHVNEVIDLQKKLTELQSKVEQCT